jgi:hypothetical protein
MENKLENRLVEELKSIGFTNEFSKRLGHDLIQIGVTTVNSFVTCYNKWLEMYRIPMFFNLVDFIVISDTFYELNFIDEEKHEKSISLVRYVKEMESNVTYSEGAKNTILELGQSKGLSLRNIDLSESNIEYINGMAKGLTGFAFRNGPIEDMHSRGQLSERDMKVLNKFMVEKLAEFFAVYNCGTEEEINYFNNIILSKDNCNTSWDDATLKDLPYDLMLGEYMEK